MSRKQEKYDARKAAADKAAEKDKAAKEALVEKVNQKGGAGKLTKEELKLAERMAPGEGEKNK